MALGTQIAPQAQLPKYRSLGDHTRDIGKSMGRGGLLLATGTEVRVGPFHTLQVIEDVVFTTLNADNMDGNTIVGVTFPVGFQILGKINSFTLASGKLLAYKFDPLNT